MKPYYEDESVVLYHGDARDVAPHVHADAVISDPPYPNNAGHFVEGIQAAVEVMGIFRAPHWLLFWHPLTTPPLNMPLVARHAWHRTNTNRPDNYEAIYEFHTDGRERACRVLPFAVIHPKLTGCIEATGHPTQKNRKLMHRLVGMTSGTIFEPFAGSGSTLIAAREMDRKAIGVEINEAYCELIVNRLAQGDLFGGVA